MSTVLECNHLAKRYGAKLALEDINFAIEPGRIVGLLGPNGSGKTTMMKIANGLLQPSGGQLLINGVKPGPETKSMVSYLPDANYLPSWMTVQGLLDFYMDFFPDFDYDKSVNMLSQLRIMGTDRLKTLSKGNKEKVQLVLAMCRNTDLYLLDEPIGGVDPAAREYILDTIISNYSENSTFVISTHLIADIEQILDEVLFINEGKILCHMTVDEIREQHGMSVDQYFREVFRC